MAKMTFEELRDEAHRQGYHLVKYNPLPQMLPCTCGRQTHFERMYRWRGEYEQTGIYCPTCHRGVWAANERKAREIWNGGALNGKDDQSSEETT